MGVYDRLKATARRLITKYGESSTYHSRPATVPKNPAQPWNPGKAEPTNYTERIAFFPIGGATKRLIRSMKDSEVETGTTLAYMASVSFKPSLKDTITRKDGTVLRIIDASPIAPNEEGAIIYEMELAE